ncbi:hypothetical protein H8F21_15045 [Pseudomonas sp. P66]|uniref:Uncharacterized protein n=1 Tax=Pseudomonas arcuscaelestis TaxID=2710591 RepID=A0ABS2BZ26_9PSED|nr:hypothetical protein [Pseudomonas arcuscaelestis]MBM5458881.1 hypothetical protein [Pseudomonas arcuscaelestis]
MDKSTGAPKPPKQKQIYTTLFALTALILAQFLTSTVWLHYSLLAIGGAGFALCAVLELQHDWAHKKWLKTQPDSADPFRGAPDLPHLKQCLALTIGFSALVALGKYGLPLSDTGFSAKDWWVIPLILLTFAGFGYAGRIQKKHNKAYLAWRDSHPPHM